MSVDPLPVSIRRVTSADVQALAELVAALARHEGKDTTARVTAATVAGWLFGPEPVCEALLAELDGRPAGYVAYYLGFSLFRGGAVLLVENLYVADAARGYGLGRRLIAAAAAEARRRGIGRIEIHVRGDSQSARAFYEHLGIAETGEFVYRIEDEALAAIAAGDGESTA
ncbi:MAG TPA: GNAT family N-acetyltransferase [Kiloniellales bacterium]